MPVTLRAPTPTDAPALAALLARNRAFFGTGEPLRPEMYYTPEGQGDAIAGAIAAAEAGAAEVFLVEEDGVLVGRANLSSIIRGAFCSASVGYLIDEEQCGRGIATQTLHLLVRRAFDDLGLHRLQGEVLPENGASQRVLAACGFTRYGTAPDYLFIQGRWRTHHLYQRTNPAWRG